MRLNLDYLLEQLWEYLALIRVYTKKPGQPPDFDDSLILRRGVSVEHVCHSIHRTLAAAFKYALVWVSTILRNSIVAIYLFYLKNFVLAFREQAQNTLHKELDCIM